MLPLPFFAESVLSRVCERGTLFPLDLSHADY